MLAGHACAEEAFIRLRQHVSLDSVVVQLGDVADITTRAPATAVRLRSVEIARFRSLVNPVKLTRAEVDVSLRHHGVPLGSIAWGGSSEVVISGRLGHVDLTPGIDEAARQLMGRFGQRGGVAIRVVDSGGEALAPPGAVSIRPDMGSMRQYGQTIELPLWVEVDGIRVAKPQLRFEIFRDAFDISTSEVRLKTSSELEFPLDRIAGMTGTEPSKPAHEPYQAQHINAQDTKDKNLLVAKDRLVRILIEAGTVQLEGQGVSLADAHQGEMVRVRRTSNNDEFLGRAIGRDLVLVEER